jgi:acetyl-CoA C-acetyltransferase
LPAEAAGQATVEAYSVMHDRDGNPERSIASCLLDDGRRAWADSTDVGLGRDMCENEWVGKRIRMDATGTLLA